MKVKFVLLAFLCMFSCLYSAENILEDITVKFVTADPSSSGYISKEISFMNLEDPKNELDVKQIDVIHKNLSSIKKILQPFFYKPLKETFCDDIKDKIDRYLDDKGYKLFSVKCVQEERKIIVTIVFGYLGKKIVVGNKYYSDKEILSKIRVSSGEQINTTRIEKDLFWLNTNPYRSVSLIYTPGETFGSTDIILDVNDRNFYRVYSGYENTDNNIGGNSRVFVGVNSGNFLMLDQELNYQFSFSPEFEEYRAHSGSYIVPLPWRNFLKFFGSYVHSEPDSGTGVRSKGRNWTASGQYVFPFTTNNFYKHSVSFGYLYQNLNNFFEYNLITQKNNRVDISQFLVFYELVKEFNKSSFRFDIRTFYSPGNMTSHNSDRYFQAERSGAKSNYFYGLIGVDSLIHLKKNWFWAFAIRGQVSSTKLMPTEELSLGGIHSIRGYKENVVIGDYGLIMNNEIRLMNIPIFKTINNNLVLLLFNDYGFAKEIDANLFEIKGSWLMSMGPGLRYNISDYFNLRFDYGFQINRVYKNSIGKAHFQAVLTY